jgi:very-short-patch-repair endonuclease
MKKDFEMRKSYPSDISRKQFAEIEPLLISARKITTPRKLDLYDVFCAILYILKTACQWRMLPNDFPKWRSVHSYFQNILCGYIVDFVCLEKRLVIELDGGKHNEEEQIKYDSVRTLKLEADGFQVLRFWNNEILTHLDGVLEAIDEALK